ncbi:hypothetical protein GCM10010520_67210 [Rhizobium viscosum]|uniref:Uncharacterized protein n=1 Tax=Rhizobium viscosum TaxID=1673 RepID=A0ABR9IU19_RHIVS|nr:hypothetical protein [Rhizobium viscosum]MBE1506696.1 hypothetical protein [Rhizobium viscosum]
MQDIRVVHAADSTPYTLGHFRETPILSIQLATGSWMLIGRVLVANTDGDPQLATAAFKVRSALTFPDRLDRTINANSLFTFPLMGVLDLPSDDTVDLVAATFEGEAVHCSIMAVPVDELDPPV